MARLEAPRIVYVSCNPTTLASDLKVLRDDFGYELRRCRPVDMFPHTPHIESVNLLELVEPVSLRRLNLGRSAPRGRARASARQSRSTFGSRKPNAIAGSAGRPATSNAVVRISVSASSPTIENQVQPTRSSKRSAAARKSAKKRMSGGPRFANPSDPGERKAIEMRSNRLGLLETT